MLHFAHCHLQVLYSGVHLESMATNGPVYAGVFVNGGVCECVQQGRHEAPVSGLSNLALLSVSLRCMCVCVDVRVILCVHTRVMAGVHCVLTKPHHPAKLPVRSLTEPSGGDVQAKPSISRHATSMLCSSVAR